MIEELMQAVLEGAQQQQGRGRQQQAQQPGGDILGEILKGVLGGGQQQMPQRRPQQQMPQGGDIFGEILKGVLGGGGGQQRQQQAPQNLGGIADILGGVLGGGRSGASTGNPIADMAANALAKKLGISPQIAGMVVSFAMAALMGKKMQADRGMAPAGSGRNQTQQGGVFGGLDLDDLLDGDFAYDSGLAAQLAEKTGQSEDESAYQLQEAVTMLTGLDQKKSRSKKKTTPKPAAKARPKSQNLESLLDTWEVD